MTTSLKVVLTCTALSLAFPTVSGAGQATPRAPSNSKWQVEIHGGGIVGGNQPAGEGIEQFPVGAAIVTGGGGRGGNSSSRAVSSWYFGDGTTVMNSALSFFGVSTRMSSMDEALRRGAVGSRTGGTVGARVSRRLTPRLAAEVDITYNPNAYQLTDESRTALSATSAAFIPAWQALLATGGTSNRTVTSNLEIDDGNSRQTFVSGGLRFDLKRHGSVQPYVSVGGGAVRNSGIGPTAVLTGRYRFDFANIFPMDESDVVTIRTVTRTTPLVVFGGGAFVGPVPGRGLKIDVRIHAGPSGADTVVDAKPNVLQLSPAFAIFTGGDPGVQFSNNPSVTARQSSLSATTDGLRTFTANGWQSRVHLSVGYVFRF